MDHCYALTCLACYKKGSAQWLADIIDIYSSLEGTNEDCIITDIVDYCISRNEMVVLQHLCSLKLIPCVLDEIEVAKIIDVS